MCYHLIFIVSTFYSVFSKLLHWEKRKMPLTVLQVCWKVSEPFVFSSKEDQNLQSLKHSLKPCKYLETSLLHIYSSFYLIRYSKTQLLYKYHNCLICFSLTGENCEQIKTTFFVTLGTGACHASPGSPTAQVQAMGRRESIRETWAQALKFPKLRRSGYRILICLFFFFQHFFSRMLLSPCKLGNLATLISF